jgi:hypothetical protein
MTETQPSDGTSSARSLGVFAMGGAVGGLAGGGAAVVGALRVKEALGVPATQPPWVLIVMRLVGLALSVAILQGYHGCQAPETPVTEVAAGVP